MSWHDLQISEAGEIKSVSCKLVEFFQRPFLKPFL